MANILSKEQCDQIRTLRTEEAKLGLEDWMTESSDDDCLIIFNNAIEVSFIVDYFGNIKSVFKEECPTFEITPELRKLAKIEGKIAQIAYWGKIKEED